MFGQLPGGRFLSVAELVQAAAEEPEPVPTGLAGLDDATGGLRAGLVWSIVGASGVGVTTLACHLAVQASRAVPTLLLQGHLSASDVLTRLRRADRSLSRTAPGHASGAGQSDLDLLSVSQWLPIDDEETVSGRHRVVIVDTFDELELPRAGEAPLDGLQRQALLRAVRRRAQLSGVSVVMTSRVTSGRNLPELFPAWVEHPWSAAHADVADVRVYMSERADRVTLAVESRYGADSSLELESVRRNQRVLQARPDAPH
ncbi:P-loop NTPase family protein [Jatrophihabitans fulvus]